MPDLTPAEELAEATDRLSEVVDELREVAYDRRVSAAIKEAALATGIDHTREPIWVIEQLRDAALARYDASKADASCADPGCRCQRHFDASKAEPTPCNFSDLDVPGAEATADYCYAHQSFEWICHFSGGDQSDDLHDATMEVLLDRVPEWLPSCSTCAALFGEDVVATRPLLDGGAV